MLYLIGLGLDNKDITLKGLEMAKKCDTIYFESYTSTGPDIKELENLTGKKIIPADRKMIEKETDQILKKNTAILVIGDPLCATTHTDLILRAKEKNITVKTVHNASIMNSIGETGLQLYKFGKTSSIPYPQGNYRAETPYNIIKQNKSIDAHTLLLLDIDTENDRYMSVNEAIQYLLDIEKDRKENVFTEETPCIGIARLGMPEQKIIFGTAKELLKKKFGKPVHCIVIPSKLHFIEEEFLKKFCSE